jgi:hypothetical protein
MFFSLRIVLTAAILISPVPAVTAAEFLTNKELEKLREAQRIDLRAHVYVEAAELRLKTAEERLLGKEPTVGDPLELFAPEDMLDAYYRIIDSIMFNVDDAIETRRRGDKNKIKKALKILSKAAEASMKRLRILERIAEEKEGLWDRVSRAIDITEMLQEGVEYGLSEESGLFEKKKSP